MKFVGAGFLLILFIYIQNVLIMNIVIAVMVVTLAVFIMEPVMIILAAVVEEVQALHQLIVQGLLVEVHTMIIAGVLVGLLEYQNARKNLVMD